MRDLLRYELRSRIGGMIGWSIGLGLFVLLYLLSYPPIADMLAGLDVGSIPTYQAFGQMDFSTFESYLASSIINFLPVLLGIYAIIDGTATLAGEEEDGTLELLATLPLRRWQIVAAKAAAMGAAALVVLLTTGLVLWAGLEVVRPQVETSLGGSQMVAASLNAWPVTVLFMMLSLWLGALLGRRRNAAMAATTLFVVSYFGNNLAVLVDPLKPLRPLSPFYYYDASAAVFSEGIEPSDAALLLAAALLVLSLAVISFQRRDLTVPPRLSLQRSDPAEATPAHP